MLGGSSSINGMVYIRGQAQDYDHWAQLGNRGWSWQDVLPVFKRMESYDGGSDELRGRDGLLRVTDTPRHKIPLLEKMIEAANKIGLPFNPDLNGATPGGHRHVAGDDRQGSPPEHGLLLSRSGARPAEPHDRAGRAGRDADPRGQALRRRALLGRTARSARRGLRARSSSAGGSINSPKLLELSGIGQGRAPALARHRAGARAATASARTCATTIRRA